MPVKRDRGLRTRRSCQSLLWGLGIFVATQLGLAVAIEYALPELRDPYYGFKRQRLEQRLEARGDSAQVVVMLGSSRTAFGLKAVELEQQLSRGLRQPVVAFNFGIPAAGPVMELLNFKRLLADGIKPDYLLVEVLPPLFCAPRDSRSPSAESSAEKAVEARWLPADRLWLRELSLLEKQGFPTHELRQAWWKTWPVPAFSHRFAIVSAFFPAWLPWNLRQDWGRGTDECGWSVPLIKHDTPADRRQAVERAHKEYDHYLNDFRLGQTPCNALRELLTECRRQNIPVALVLMPEGPTFQSWYSPRAQREVETFLNELKEEYQAPLIDCRSWIGEEGFSDSHHLVIQGATQFTERLGREVLPLLQPERAQKAF